MSTAPAKVSTPTIVVAGDVCIDWLSIPIESMAPSPDARPMNWQLRGGRRMYARRGGAWLTGDFVERAVGDSARVLKSAKEETDLESVPPERIIHSMIMLGRGQRERDKDKVPFWIAAEFEGYAGPTYPNPPEVKPVENDDPKAELVLLDDAGNGFRDRADAWPAALAEGCDPLIIYKVRRPLDEGALWDRLKCFHLERTIAVLGADELRGEGGSISRGLSWERTATDLILALGREPRFAGLRGCPFLIITLGIEGAVLVRCVGGRVAGARLWYLPNLTEGEVLRMGRGTMSGFGAAFAAALTASLVTQANRASDLDKIDGAARAGIHRGLRAMDRLLEHAFGPCEMVDPTDESQKVTRPPEYPVSEIFDASQLKAPSVFDVALPDLPAEGSHKELSRFRSWRILDSKRHEVFVELATNVVMRGAERVFDDVPIGTFGKLATLDRLEIESYRGISNLIKGFLDNPRPDRPLCLAVFGPPGGGKSFGVTEVARALDKDGRIEKLDFNVSQWNGPEYLVSALHRVRDHALRGKVPLVFFDEFDSQFGRQKLGWLKYFLAPMQDGAFADGFFTHDIGKAIFVFAGGTATTFAEFCSKPESSHSAAAESKDESKNVKLPDFVSRLRGHVDIFGLDPPTDSNLLRRALVLRSNIKKKYPKLIDASGAARMDPGVVRAFLQTPDYYHGARSIEAILEMSRLVDCYHFDPSLLPPAHQLSLHVDGNAFMLLAQHQPALGPMIDQIAEDIHESYVSEELGKKDEHGKRLHQLGDWPSLVHWKDLSEMYKRSNREQGAHYPTLLAAAGCSFEWGAADEKFEYSENEVEKLAQMEHARWMKERRIKQPDHPDLVAWDKLKPEEREKDVRTIKEIPRFLAKVGLRIVRL